MVVAEKTETEYLIIDVADLPPPVRAGPPSAFSDVLRSLPVGKAAFRPFPPNAVVRNTSVFGGAFSRLGKERGLKMHMRTDRERDGVWYWFTDDTAP